MCHVNVEALTAPVLGRPRDRRIDLAVLGATVELLEEVGYLHLTVSAIADRAGTTTPAIYRRWPSKARLVHEAVFPAGSRARTVTPGKDLRGDIRALVLIEMDSLGRPAARAALPGLLAEGHGAATLSAGVLGRFSRGASEWLQRRIDDAVAVGDVRAGVHSSTVCELVIGATFVASGTRPRGQLDEAWIDGVVSIILRGIAA